MAGQATQRRISSASRTFDVGVDERVGPVTAVSIGFQNILGLAGLLIFPGLLGQGFGLSPTDTAYLYGVTFMTSGLVVILQSVLLLRLPIVQGPYAGVFAALLVVGHQRGGLGTAFGSLLVASLIWLVLAVPIKRYSFVGALARYVNLPIVTGVILIIISTQLATIALPGWFGTPESPGFPGVNALVAAVAALSVLACMAAGRTVLRRGAVLWGVILGSVLYTLLEPTTWGNVADAPVFNAPQAMPFGFHVDALSVATFFVVLFPAIAETLATYELVSRWGEQELPGRRSSQGVFGEMLGSAVGAAFGGMATLAYPDNVGFLKITRVGSRYVTLTTGIILLVLGGFGMFDAALVAVPPPVLAGATTVLFAILFASGLETLSRVRWEQGNLIAAGLPFIVGIGALFTPEDVLERLPSSIHLMLGQPLVLGTVLSLATVGILGVARRGEERAADGSDRRTGPPQRPTAGQAPPRASRAPVSR